MNLQQPITTGQSHMAECFSALDQKQITLEVGRDFEKFAEIIEVERPSQKLGDPFNFTKQFLPASRGFWIIGRNPSGKLMHTQAVRLLHLRQQTLAAYMANHYKEFPPGGVEIDFDQSWYHPGPGAGRISGRVAYHGEMWVDNTCGTYRGGKLVDILARVAFLKIEEKLKASHVFGYMLRSVARRGLAEREGYLHIDPYCLSWKLQEREEAFDCNMVYMDRADMQHSIEVPLLC